LVLHQSPELILDVFSQDMPLGGKERKEQRKYTAEQKRRSEEKSSLFWCAHVPRRGLFPSKKWAAWRVEWRLEFSFSFSFSFGENQLGGRSKVRV
jgi:hypothetical protein